MNFDGRRDRETEGQKFIRAELSIFTYWYSLHSQNTSQFLQHSNRCEEWSLTRSLENRSSPQAREVLQAGTGRNEEMLPLYHEQPHVWVELRQFLEVLLVFTDQSVLFSLLHSFFVSVCSLASGLFLPAGVLSLHCILAGSLFMSWKSFSTIPVGVSGVSGGNPL